MSTVQQQTRQLEPGKFIELYTIDAQKLGMTTNLYFHPYIELGTDSITFQGHSYVAFPIKGEGWDWSTQTQLPRPKITIANIDSEISAYLRQYGDFVGATFIRRRTYAEFLDGVGGTNHYAEEFTPDVFTVERKTMETNSHVEFELTSAFDAEGIALPRRQILGTFCPWEYRGDGCLWAGPPKADLDDHLIGVGAAASSYRGGLWDAAYPYSYPINVWVYVLTVDNVRVFYVSRIANNTYPLSNTTAWARDSCSKTVAGCKLRFGATGILNFGGFPGCQKIPG